MELWIRGSYSYAEFVPNGRYDECVTIHFRSKRKETLLFRLLEKVDIVGFSSWHYTIVEVPDEKWKLIKLLADADFRSLPRHFDIDDPDIFKKLVEFYTPHLVLKRITE